MTDESTARIGKVIETLPDFERLEKKKQVEGLSQVIQAISFQGYLYPIDLDFFDLIRNSKLNYQGLSLSFQ